MNTQPANPHGFRVTETPWLTLLEAAQYLRFDHVDTAPKKAADAMRQLARRRGIPTYRRGTRILFDRRDLDKWIRDRRAA